MRLAEAQVLVACADGATTAELAAAQRGKETRKAFERGLVAYETITRPAPTGAPNTTTTPAWVLTTDGKAHLSEAEAKVAKIARRRARWGL